MRAEDGGLPVYSVVDFASSKFQQKMRGCVGRLRSVQSSEVTRKRQSTVIQSHSRASLQVLGLNSKPFSQTLGDSARLVSSVLDTKDLWKLHYKNAKYL